MKKRQVRASVVMGLLIVASSVCAEEHIPAGFLEFLGGMVETDGELVDPLILELPMDSVVAENQQGIQPAHEPDASQKVEIE